MIPRRGDFKEFEFPASSTAGTARPFTVFFRTASFSTGSATHLVALTSTRTKAQNTIPSGRLTSNPQFVELFRLRQMDSSGPITF